MNSHDQAINNALRLMKEQSINQRDLSELTRMSTTHISRLFSKKVVMTTEDIDKLSIALKTTPGELLGKREDDINATITISVPQDRVEEVLRLIGRASL